MQIETPPNDVLIDVPVEKNKNIDLRLDSTLCVFVPFLLCVLRALVFIQRHIISDFKPPLSLPRQ